LSPERRREGKRNFMNFLCWKGKGKGEGRSRKREGREEGVKKKNFFELAFSSSHVIPAPPSIGNLFFSFFSFLFFYFFFSFLFFYFFFSFFSFFLREENIRTKE